MIVAPVGKKRSQGGLCFLSAVSQNQPLKVEIKGFKTSHFLEQKTAPRNSPDAGPMEHVECRTPTDPVEVMQTRIYGLDDRGWSRRRIARELGIDREPWAVFAVSKTSHFDHRA